MLFYTIRNKNGLKAIITSKGAKLVSLVVPDMEGNPVDVIYGFDKIENPYNAINLEGFIWNTRQHDECKLELNYSSKYITDDFQLNFYVKLIYSLNDQNCLTIAFEASSGQSILINHPNHIFFNLNGKNDESVLKHQLFIKADSYFPVNDAKVAIGHTDSVTGTPFDFRNSATIGARINDHHIQLKNGNGYCHYYLLNRHSSRTPVAKVKGDKTSIIMEVCTDQPKVLFCSGDNMQHYDVCKETNKKNSLFALSFIATDFHEAQYPAQLPIVALKPKDIYKTVCSFLFKI